MGNLVRKFRRDAEMTQKALADDCQTTRQTIIAIEKGRTPSPLLMHAIAKRLGKTVDEIFFAESVISGEQTESA